MTAAINELTLDGLRGCGQGEWIYDRAAETAALLGVLAAALDGRSGVLVLRGDPGIGKSMLLDWTAGQAPGMRLARVAGIQAEKEMGFAGLHQMLVPFLGGLDELPSRQQQALGSAFGLVTGPPPDRFLVALAALTLLTDAAAGPPVLCLIDDAQWLDRASVDVLGFIARRLYADRVSMVLTVREGEDRPAALDGLPELVVSGLPEAAAGQLLTASAGAPVDGQVSRQIVSEVAGNPLALVELAGELTPDELSGTVPLRWPLQFGGRLEELYLARILALPADARTLLQVAAADPTGDPALVAAASRSLGTDLAAGETPSARRLVSWRPRVRFRHPLVRSAAYYAASAPERRAAHAALAAVTDPAADSGRRAWHLAESAAGPDEQVAAELERSAGRAQARGGLAAAAALLERSVRLTDDPARQSDRALAAAQCNLQAGSYGQAKALLDTTEAGPLDELARARVDLVRGQLAYASSMGREAPALLLKAARRLEPLDLGLARTTYLTAWCAALMAGHLAGVSLAEVCRAARALPVGNPPRPVDRVLDGLARLGSDGPAAATPALRQALRAFAAGDVSREEGLRWGTLAATALWDEDAGHAIAARQVELARAAGALQELSADLELLAVYETRRGDFTAASSQIAEAGGVAEATGSRIAPYGAMRLAALQGDEERFTGLTAAAMAVAETEGQGIAATSANWLAVTLYNGLGRYADAFAAAGRAREHSDMFSSLWGLPELIEAAVRTGRPEAAAGALAELTETTRPGGADFGRGIEARSRALVSEGEAAETCYREALARLGRTRRQPDLARAHLLYGEWLRRQRRRRDAREQLGTAFALLDAMGMAAFAARARAELRATGEQVQPRGSGPLRGLTPQEERVAWLVAEHQSNREIAARLFLSVSTVEYHLGKVFRKLSLASRAELARLLRDGAREPALGTAAAARVSP